MDNNEYSSSSMFLLSLEKLSLIDMHNLKGWWNGETSSEASPNNALFPITMSCLCELKIDACPHLASIPWCAPLKSLQLSAISSQLLNMVIEMTLNHCVEESSSTRSKVSYVHLSKIEDLEFLPKELFYHFKDLKQLSITDCKSLQISSSLVQHPANVIWKESPSLPILILNAILKLEYLPNGMQHVTTLQHIHISSCLNLITLPEWIGDFTSLSDLMIRGCPKLISLSERIHHLPSLQFLDIRDCPKLKERYKKGKGEDWPKTSHIPFVRIT